LVFSPVIKIRKQNPAAFQAHGILINSPVL